MIYIYTINIQVLSITYQYIHPYYINQSINQSNFCSWLISLKLSLIFPICFTFPKSQKGQETCNLDPLCCKGNFHSENIGVEAQANIGDEYFAWLCLLEFSALKYFAWLLFAGNFRQFELFKTFRKQSIHEESIWSHVQKCNSFALTTLEEQQN